MFMTEVAQQYTHMHTHTHTHTHTQTEKKDHEQISLEWKFLQSLPEMNKTTKKQN